MNSSRVESLTALTRALIDQRAAEVVVEPQSRASGFWFGGGNMAVDRDGRMVITGRYRNSGDSTTGLAKGARGLELALFRSTAPFRIGGPNSFEKVAAFSKADLSVEGATVLSIEGTALRIDDAGVELYVSTEKAELPYPEGLEAFKKPGTGVWTIDRLSAADVNGLKESHLETVIAGSDPRQWHIKDPVVHHGSDGKTLLFFCTHPFSWTSSNSGYLELGATSAGEANYTFFPRGNTWDVAVSRITDALEFPPELLGTTSPATLVFYDGAECMRAHDENPNAVSRPRGYSCEEIAGLALYTDWEPKSIERISKTGPLFLSPYGTGSCRYIHTVQTEEGIVATWQQSQQDGSQPLVMNGIRWDYAKKLLGN